MPRYWRSKLGLGGSELARSFAERCKVSRFWNESRLWRVFGVFVTDGGGG